MVLLRMCYMCVVVAVCFSLFFLCVRLLPLKFTLIYEIDLISLYITLDVRYGVNVLVWQSASQFDLTLNFNA